MQLLGQLYKGLEVLHIALYSLVLGHFGHTAGMEHHPRYVQHRRALQRTAQQLVLVQRVRLAVEIVHMRVRLNEFNVQPRGGVGNAAHPILPALGHER